MSYDEALYNIGVVSRMTDIPSATLRVWERRYGFPEPERTEGGHRLYSEREVQRLRWVKAKVDGGMQTRQAVKALQAQDEETSIVAEVPTTPVPAQSPDELPAVITGPTAHAHLTILHQRLLASLLAHDTTQAEQIFNETLALYSPERLILDVIRPTIHEIGLGWERGEVDVATEHLITNYLRQHLLMWLRTGPPPYAVPPTVLACAPGEWHDGSLLILGALLRRRRWPLAYVGQSLPLADLAQLVKTIHPLAVVVVAMMEDAANALAAWPAALPEAAQTGHPIVAYGGLVFNTKPELRARVPGLYLGTTFHEGVETLERVLRNETTRLKLSL